MTVEIVTATLGELEGWARERSVELERPPDWRQPLQQCRVAIARDVRRNFEEGHDPDGNPWLPLKYPRARTGGADQPLRNNGLLMASITEQSAEGHLEELTDTALVMGTNLPYAHLQQEGGTVQGNPLLAIPLSREAARVQSRHPARDFESVNNIPLVLISRKGGKAPLLVEKRDERRLGASEKAGQGRKRVAGRGQKTELGDYAPGERWVIHFILVPKVTVPARRFLGFGRRLIDKCTDLLGRFLARRTRGGGGQGPEGIS